MVIAHEHIWELIKEFTSNGVCPVCDNDIIIDQMNIHPKHAGCEQVLCNKCKFHICLSCGCRVKTNDNYYHQTQILKSRYYNRNIKANGGTRKLSYTQWKEKNSFNIDDAKVRGESMKEYAAKVRVEEAIEEDIEEDFRVEGASLYESIPEDPRFAPNDEGPKFTITNTPQGGIEISFETEEDARRFVADLTEDMTVEEIENMSPEEVSTLVSGKLSGTSFASIQDEGNPFENEEGN